MLTAGQWLGEAAGRWHPHLMFYAPFVASEHLGGNAMGSAWPFVIGGRDGHTGRTGNITVVLPDEDFIEPARLQYLDPAVLADPGRPAADREQDPGRRALEVYEWLGLRPGMSVADVYAGPGYNTHLLSLSLGESSTIYSVIGFFAPLLKERFDVDAVKPLRERLAAADLGKVRVLETLEELPTGTLDAVLSVRNFHDIEYFGGSASDALAEMRRALKPGGIVGVVEVATHHPGWHEETHRLGAEAVIDAFEAAGFELEARSDLLADPADDHTTRGFAEGRHTMDRYLLRFRLTARGSLSGSREGRGSGA